MNLTKFQRQKIRLKLLEARKNYGGSDKAFAQTFGINSSVYSRIKKGETENVLSDTQWLTIGRTYNVTFNENNWRIARTEVYTQIEDNLKHCQKYSTSMILVDTWGIGKTETAKQVAKKLKNAFYLDASQCKTKILFTRTLAKTIGLDNRGRYNDVKANIKYYLNLLETPLVIVDEAGDMEYPAFLDLKEYWNGTENQCAWYMIGDDSLRKKVDNGIEKQKVGYGSIFSRFSGEYISLTPVVPEEKTAFFTKLLSDVAKINCQETGKISKLVKNSIGKEKKLRYLKNLIQVNA